MEEPQDIICLGRLANSAPYPWLIEIPMIQQKKSNDRITGNGKRFVFILQIHS